MVLAWALSWLLVGVRCRRAVCNTPVEALALPGLALVHGGLLVWVPGALVLLGIGSGCVFRMGDLNIGLVP